jgi:hypothetical protein
MTPEQVNNAPPRYHRRRHRRPQGRPLLLTLALRVDHETPPVVPQDAQCGPFAVQLARRLSSVHPDVLEALSLERPQWRTDHLLELGADLSDALVAYGQGLVGESVVRTAALDVAAEAGAVWTATCGLPLDTETAG